MSLLRSSLTFSSLTLVSRVFGFIRDILIAHYVGARLVADCFFIAFKLPNFFRRLFAEGAFNAAFVPMFAGELGEGAASGRARAKRFAEATLAILLPVLLLFTALVEIFMGPFVWLLTGGFADEDPDKFPLAVELTRLTFPYLMLISLVSLLSGTLNALKRFAAAAAAPILLNLTLITSLLAFHETELIAGRSLAAAVSIGGVVQLCLLLVACKRAGFALRLPRPRVSPEIKQLLALFFPAALGAGVVQLNLLIDMVLAARFLPEGSISFLFYADRLNQLPIGLVGVAIGTVLLPLMARHLAAGEADAAVAQQNRAMELALLLTLPAAAALIVVPGPLINAIFEHGGAFTPADAAATSAALAAYAVGLPAYVLVKVLTPGYHGRKDTRTPLKFAVVALVTNTALNLILMIPLQHVGFALATALSSWLSVALLWGVLARRGHFKADARLRSRILRSCLASAVMAAAVFGLARLVADRLAAGGVGEIAAVAAIVIVGLVVFFAAARATGALRRDEIKTALRRP